jgi:hypothetical protein
VRLTSIVFKADDPELLAEFWMLLDWYAEPAANGEYRLVPPEEDGSTVELRFVPAEHRAKAGKNRVHLDVNTGSGHEYNTRREAWGYVGRARKVDVGQGELVPWTVYADREGNEFCLLKPRDRYIDSGAVAAIVVDSGDPEALAAFWSTVTGWEIVERDPACVSLRAPEKVGPFLEFTRVADRDPEPGPVLLGLESYWPHQHDGDLARLVELGANVMCRNESHTILADPEGNEFRVTVPHPPRRV